MPTKQANRREADMTTTDLEQGVKASRMRVPRSRGAFSGIVLVVLGAWAALVPFIGPYFDFAFTPAPNDAWHWTSGRGWLELLPGVAAVVGGLLLLAGTNRVVLTFASWLGVAGGAWLVVGPVLAPRISLSTGAPESSGGWVQTLEALFFFYAIGAGILFFGASALGRLSVHSVRDARAAQRRVEADAAREAEERRLAEERATRERTERDRFERERAERERADADRAAQERAAQQQNGGATAAGNTSTTTSATPVTNVRQDGTAEEPTMSSGQYRVQHDGVTETREYPTQNG
jgi:hypothetical protein